MFIEMNYEEWLEKFKPFPNRIDKNANYDGCMYETYGDEYNYVKGANPENIWTLTDYDGELFIYNGLGFVNRMGYFIVKTPSNPKDDYQIYVSYDMGYDKDWLPCDECGEHNMDWNMSPNNNLICNNCEDEMVELLNA